MGEWLVEQRGWAGGWASGWRRAGVTPPPSSGRSSRSAALLRDPAPLSYHLPLPPPIHPLLTRRRHRRGWHRGGRWRGPRGMEESNADGARDAWSPAVFSCIACLPSIRPCSLARPSSSPALPAGVCVCVCACVCVCVCVCVQGGVRDGGSRRWGRGCGTVPTGWARGRGGKGARGRRRGRREWARGQGAAKYPGAARQRGEPPACWCRTERGRVGGSW